MRILHVTNEFSPHGHGGVAEHVWAIARAQSQRHDVAIFTRFGDPSLPDGHVYTERRGRVTIRFFNRGALEWTPFERSYVHHDVEAEFKLFLGELRSDVVHFHDLETLGIGLLEIVRSLNIKSVMTARDFWPMCPLKHRVCRTDGSTCDTIDLAKCGPCLHGEHWNELRDAEVAEHEARRPAPPETFSQSWKRLYRQRYDATRGVKGRRPLAAVHATHTALREAKWKAQEQFHEQFGDSIERRMDRFTRHMRDLDLLLAPSEFVRDQYIARFGLSPAKALFSAASIDVGAVRVAARTPSKSLRVGFCGSASRADGLRVLVDAFLEAAEQSQVLELHVHVRCADVDRGELEALRERVLASPVAVRVHWHEDYEFGRFDAACAALDLLVVPTLGLGNPSFELERASLHGLPVLASDSAGNAEFCGAHRIGRTFARGAAHELATELLSLAIDPAALAALASEPPAIKSPEYEGALLALTYHQLLYGTFQAPTAAEQAAARSGEPEPQA
ncbi:MAG: glycosyltransferase [Planctomycetes bacterium]|nr:glycosyltransferase [Planctomycetota bacterium]